MLFANEGHTVPDRLGFRKRIGIVVPSTNTTVQPECEVLRPRGDHQSCGTLDHQRATTQYRAGLFRAYAEYARGHWHGTAEIFGLVAIDP